MTWASIPRALSQRASQKPSRPASKATVIRSIFCSAFSASARHRSSSFKSWFSSAASFFQRLALHTRYDPKSADGRDVNRRSAEALAKAKEEAATWHKRIVQAHVLQIAMKAFSSALLASGVIVLWIARRFRKS
jgi:hypothetical protein